MDGGNWLSNPHPRYVPIFINQEVQHDQYSYIRSILTEPKSFHYWNNHEDVLLVLYTVHHNICILLFFPNFCSVHDIGHHPCGLRNLTIKENSGRGPILIIPSDSTQGLEWIWKEGILVSRRLSICPSGRLFACLWTKSCRSISSTIQIHFIFVHLIKQLQKVCCV